jgi:tripartite-type tricarboxylate transporter receptor subunit TctC
MRILAAVIAFICLGVMPASSAAAADYPKRIVSIVVPFPAGGTADALPRIIGQKLQARWGQPVIIENRPGAAGTTGSAVVANAAPNGYMLLASPAGPLVINKFVQKSFPFDPLKLTPITVAAAVPTVLAMRSSLPASTVQDLIVYGKAQRAGLTYASQGPGSTSHLSAVMFQNMTGLEMVHVPYRGSSPALADLIAGNVDLMFDNLGSALSLHQAAQIKILAVGSAERAPALPDVPTLSESGLPDYRSSTWFALVGPSNIPADIANLISKDVVEILAMPEVVAKLTTLGLQPVGTDPEKTQAFIVAETKRWELVTQAANLEKE